MARNGCLRVNSSVQGLMTLNDDLRDKLCVIEQLPLLSDWLRSVWSLDADPHYTHLRRQTVITRINIHRNNMPPLYLALVKCRKKEEAEWNIRYLHLSTQTIFSGFLVVSKKNWIWYKVLRTTSLHSAGGYSNWVWQAARCARGNGGPSGKLTGLCRLPSSSNGGMFTDFPSHKIILVRNNSVFFIDTSVHVLYILQHNGQKWRSKVLNSNLQLAGTCP